MSDALDTALAGVMEALGEVDAANRESHKLIHRMEGEEQGQYIFEVQYNLCLRAVLMVVPDIDTAGRIVTAFLLGLADLRKRDQPRKKH